MLKSCLYTSSLHRWDLSASRQKGLTTSHLHTQIDPFALKLTDCKGIKEKAWNIWEKCICKNDWSVLKYCLLISPQCKYNDRYTMLLFVTRWASCKQVCMFTGRVIKPAYGACFIYRKKSVSHVYPVVLAVQNHICVKASTDRVIKPAYGGCFISRKLSVLMLTQCFWQYRTRVHNSTNSLQAWALLLYCNKIQYSAVNIITVILVMKQHNEQKQPINILILFRPQHSKCHVTSIKWI